MKNILSVNLLFLVFIGACSNNKSFGSKEEAIDFIKDENNGYSQTKDINGITINMTYRPTDLIILQEDTDNNYSAARKDSLRKKYDRFLYFILSYSKDHNEILSTVPSSREQFNALQNTLTFGMDKAVCLTNEKKDTIPIVGANFPRTYGMARSTNVLLVFERNKRADQSETFSVNVLDFGLGIGDLKFEYPKEIIQKKQFTY